MNMTGDAPTGNPNASPIPPTHPTWSIPPEIQAIPARAPGFEPRQAYVGGEQAALRPAAGSEAPPPVWQEPPTQELPRIRFESGHELVHGPGYGPGYGPAYGPGPEAEPEFSRRRNNLVIGASTAAALAVAIGAISLTHKSAPPAQPGDEGFSATFGPGAGDPTEAPNDGQPLDGSTSVPLNQSSTTQTTASANPPPTVAAAPTTPPAPAAAPKPNPAPAKPAAVCTGWHTTHIPAHDGKAYAAATSALHAGPYATCAPVGATFGAGHRMYVWCHAVNAYGATWVYGLMDGTTAPGWQAVTALKAGAERGPVC